jgi:hypothetical protein
MAKAQPNIAPSRTSDGKRLLWRRTLRIAVGLVAVLGLASALGVAEESAPTAAYEIFLLRPDGKPAAGAVLRVMGVERELAPLTADDRGRVRVEGLTAGEPAFFLATSAGNRLKAFVPILVVPEGTQRLEVRLYPPGVVRGEIVDELGQPVQGLAVRLSGWEWLEEPELAGEAVTDELGRFGMSGLVPGAYYSVEANQGSDKDPARTWRSHPFTVLGWDGWYDVGILLPENDKCAERPAGKTAATVCSGPEDEWFDLGSREWHHAVETYDPNLNWAPAPEGAEWIWRAGRPDAAAERYGATVEFRRTFTVPAADQKIVGYLTVGADDYAAIRLNGAWAGQTNQFMGTVGLLIPSELLKPGRNELRLTVRNVPGMMRDFYNPSGVTYRLELIEVE